MTNTLANNQADELPAQRNRLVRRQRRGPMRRIALPVLALVISALLLAMAAWLLFQARPWAP